MKLVYYINDNDLKGIRIDVKRVIIENGITTLVHLDGKKNPCSFAFSIVDSCTISKSSNGKIIIEEI